VRIIGLYDQEYTTGLRVGEIGFIWSFNCNVPRAMTAASALAHIDTRYECLDLFPIHWGSSETMGGNSDSGILLEIWTTGGLVQTSVPIPEGSRVDLELPAGTIQALVTGCEQDDYGFLVALLIHRNQRDAWFPGYCPPYLRPDRLDS